MKHIHADLIHAWADGAEIQAKSNDVWLDCPIPMWYTTAIYRIKPETKPDIVHYPKFVFDYVRDEGKWFTGNKLKITFDGETGMLKGAEVI